MVMATRMIWVSLIVLAVFLVGGVLLQIFLSKRESKWPGLVLPAISFLWSLLFVIPGIIASYRYRFALYNLYENPDIGILEALNMSKRQTLGYKGQVFMLDLSYIGWNLLATLPSMIEAGVLYWSVLESTGLYDAAVFSVQVSPFAFIPLWVWTLVCSLWTLLVSLFYLPNYQCVELGYFDTANTF